MFPGFWLDTRSSLLYESQTCYLPIHHSDLNILIIHLATQRVTLLLLNAERFGHKSYGTESFSIRHNYNTGLSHDQHMPKFTREGADPYKK